MLLQRLIPGRAPTPSTALNLATREDRNDLAFVTRAVSLNGANLAHASPRLRANGHVVLAALANRGQALEFAAPALQNDREIAMAAVTNNGLALKFATLKVRNRKAVVLAAVRSNGLALEFGSKALKEDRDVVAAAAQQNGFALQKFAAGALKEDYELNFMAIQQDGECYSELPSALRDDRALAILALERNGHALRFFSREFRGDRGIVLAAVRTKGRALHHARRHLRADREIVSAAVQQTWHALQYASAELRADPTLVIGECGEASGGRALQFADDLALDKEQALMAVKSSGRAFRRLSPELRADRDVCLAAVRLDGEVIRYASNELRADNEVVLTSVTRSGRALQWASAALHGSHEVCLAACQQDGRALHVCAPAVRGFRDFSSGMGVARFDKALQGSLAAYCAKVKADDKGVVLAACTNYGLALAHASVALQNDREIVLAAVRQNGRALRYAGRELRADKDVVALALAQPECGSAIHFASEDLRKDRYVVLAAAAFDWDGEKCAADEIKNADKHLPARRADRHFVSDVALAALSVQENAPLRPRGEETWRRPRTGRFTNFGLDDVAEPKTRPSTAPVEWFPNIQPFALPQQPGDWFPGTQSLATTLESSSLGPVYERSPSYVAQSLGDGSSHINIDDELPPVDPGLGFVEGPVRTRKPPSSARESFLSVEEKRAGQGIWHVPWEQLAVPGAPPAVLAGARPAQAAAFTVPAANPIAATETTASRTVVEQQPREVKHSAVGKPEAAPTSKQAAPPPAAKPEFYSKPPATEPFLTLTASEDALAVPLRTAITHSTATADDPCLGLEEQILELVTRRAPHNLLMLPDGCANARAKDQANPALGLEALLIKMQGKYSEGYSQVHAHGAT